MQRKYFLLTIAVIAMLLYSMAGIAASPYWSTANPLSDDMTPTGNLTLYGVYHPGSGTGPTVAVGERGAILTGTNSTDGSNRVNWVARQSGLTIDLNDVIYDGSQYIVIGGRVNGVIVTSTDLVNWQSEIVGENTRLRGIAYGQVSNNPPAPPSPVYVIVGDNGSILTSPDAITWTTVNSGTGMALLDVLWDNYRKQFIAVGGGTAGGIILTSNDGQNWNQVQPGFSLLHILQGICINNDPASINYKKLVIVGDAGTIYTSTDGTSWSQITSPTDQQLLAVAYNTTYSKYVAVGSQGTIMTSAAGNNWTTVLDSGTTNNLYAITWNGTHIIVTGTNTLLTPTDATLQNWQFGNSRISDTLNLSGVATDGSGTSLAVTATGEVFSSSDGLDWQPVTTIGPVPAFRTLTWDGSQYVAIDNGNAIATSTDGSSWSTVGTSGLGTGLNGIAYSGSAYVAVGNNDTLQKSTDLISWTTVSIPTGNGNLTGVTWNPDANNSSGEFLVVTDNAKVLHGNASGQSWTAVAATEFRIKPLSTALNAVSWNGSQYVAVGPLGAIVYSDNGDDGNDWQHVAPADTFRDFKGVTWVPALERFITVGDNGIVMTSAGVDMGAYTFSQTSSAIATELEPFGYSFQARNNGNFHANNIVMTVTLPPPDPVLGPVAKFGGTYDSRCTEAVPDLKLTCNLGNLNGGGSFVATVYVPVTPLSPLIHTDLAVTVDVTAAGPEALPNDNQVVTATYVQSIEDKIASDYNSKLGGTGRLDQATLGLLLFLALLTTLRQRRLRAGYAG